MLISEPMQGAALEKYHKILSRASWVRTSKRGYTMPVAVKYHRPVITMVGIPAIEGNRPDVFVSSIRVIRGKAWYSDGSDGPIEYEVKVKMWDTKTMDRWRKIAKAIQGKMLSGFKSPC